LLTTTSEASDGDTVRTAFLSLDFVTYIVENCSHDDTVAERAAAALGAARRAGLPVFHVVPAPMIDQFYPPLAPAEGETVLGKSSISAFATTNLDDRLREAGVGQVIIAGVATSGTVLSTTRWAADIGYKVIVCADACADMDAGAHAALVDQRVFPTSWLGLWRFGRVLPAAEISELA
jgi:nicotinamidase-related amidase